MLNVFGRGFESRHLHQPQPRLRLASQESLNRRLPAVTPFFTSMPLWRTMPKGNLSAHARAESQSTSKRQLHIVEPFDCRGSRGAQGERVLSPNG